MKPVVVMPMSDPSGVVFPHLKAITPTLKDIFAQAFVSVPVATQVSQPEHVAWLKSDSFFHTIYHEADIRVGDDFSTLYSHAAHFCDVGQVLHLCYIDRVAFALQTDHREQFISDVQEVDQEHTPLIFHRSQAAWDTHPNNYREIEQMVTRVGELLFGRTLDFAWCHLVATASQLRQALPYVKSHDLSMVAEIVALLRDNIQTKDVDWLAWEDPFIFARDPQQLRHEREHSLQETHKRLSYVIPMLQHLYTAANDQKGAAKD